uniref:BTB domain-containing protein n=1 Tax=Oncorhynchus tshawytscha TaxID=74940 RepID=A0AAZ3RR37_ONCTS
MPSEPCVSGQQLVTDQRLCQSKSHQDSVLSALNQQRKDGLLCDVTLVAGDQKFHAHKAVLAACSDYFRAMFSLCMVESEADEVTLQGVTSVGLKHALDFAYTGQIMLEPGVIQDVLSAGSHLQLLELLSLCSHYLVQELNSVNYLDLYRVADLFHLPALEEAVVSFLVEHLCELQQSRQEEVLLLPYRLLREVLKSDRLTSLNEEEIWQLVVCWLEHDCRYQYTEDLIQHVRYGLMDVAALHHVAQCHPLVQSSATAAALVDEALEYHRATYAQPLRQTAHTKPRFQSLTLYIAGGRKREVSRVRELRYFNPAAQETVRVAGCSNWSELAPMPAGRSHHCVAVMGHFLFVAGGEVEHSTGRTCAVRTACRYDPRGNRWTEIASMKACREHFVLGALGQYLYAVGGRNELRQVLPTVERYCPKRNKWTFVQSFDRSLSCHAGCVADDLLWVSGGVTNTAQYQNRLMVYDPEQDVCLRACETGGLHARGRDGEQEKESKRERRRARGREGEQEGEKERKSEEGRKEGRKEGRARERERASRRPRKSHLYSPWSYIHLPGTPTPHPHYPQQMATRQLLPDIRNRTHTHTHTHNRSRTHTNMVTYAHPPPHTHIHTYIQNNQTHLVKCAQSHTSV